MDRKEFMAIVKELNQDEELLAKIGERKIRVVGVKTEQLIENFGVIMIKLDDVGLTDEVSEDCIDFFEANLDVFLPSKEEPGESSDKMKESNVDEIVDKELEEEPPVEEERKEEKKSKEVGRNVVIKFLSDLVDEGKYTRKEIVEKAVEQFPDKSKNYFGTYLSDGKNPKYCKFDSLIIVDAEGVLSFEK